MSFSFVILSFYLVLWLSAIENVQVPLSLAGEPASVQQARAAELLNRVGLSDRMHHLPTELSQGQQQRVALKRTPVNEPQVILADEPTGNLDQESREQIMNLLSECQCDGGSIAPYAPTAKATTLRCFFRAHIRAIEHRTGC